MRNVNFLENSATDYNNIYSFIEAMDPNNQALTEKLCAVYFFLWRYISNLGLGLPP
jgi:hypothetical protein